MKYTIYILFDPLEKIYIYIGQSGCPRDRLKAHRLKMGGHIEMEIIQNIWTTKANALKIEKYWITQFSAWGFELLNRNTTFRIPNIDKNQIKTK